jgi:HAD superfamily hydrolase (TIGR01509 family)
MKQAAIFDVDGTLVDTNHLHVVTWWEAFHQSGQRVAMPSIHRAVGLASGDLIAHLLGDERDHDQDSRIAAAHSALYATYFERLPALEGAGDLLRALAERDWRIVLATSASGSELAALRRAIDADEAIFAAASADDVAAGKPAPDPVQLALDLAGVPPERAVFVGDTAWDMQAADRAGVQSIATLSGGIPQGELEAAGAAAVYDDPLDLLTHLHTSLFSQIDG